MKRIGVLLTLLAAVLVAASFAFADDGGKGKDKQKDAQKCRNISLKGTAPATTFTVTVDKANKAGRDLKTATVTFSGKVHLNAQLCSGDSSASASTLKLRNLKVGKTASSGDGG
jgi:hypothetical protein